MKNNLTIIQQDINQLTENQKRVFLEKEKQKQIKEFKEHCKELIQNKLIGVLERNNYCFFEVLFNKYEIIGHLIDEINAETITKEIQKSTTREELIKTGALFKTIKTQEKRFNYDYKFINEILTSLFDTELSKIEKEHHKKEKYQKEYLKEKIKQLTMANINDLLNEMTINEIIDALYSNEVKQATIDEISENENDIAILGEIYTSTINEIKKEYKYTIEQEKRLTQAKNKQSNQINIPLPFKLLALGKGLKALWKL